MLLEKCRGKHLHHHLFQMLLVASLSASEQDLAAAARSPLRNAQNPASSHQKAPYPGAAWSHLHFHHNGVKPAFPPPPTPTEASGEEERKYIDIANITFLGICNAEGLGEAGLAKAPPAPSSDGWVGEISEHQWHQFSFCTTGIRSLPPLNQATSATEMLHRRCHAVAPATYRNIKVLLSCRVNSSNALSKG